MKTRWVAVAFLKSSIPSNMELELVFRPDGTVESAWWTKEIGKLLCGICGMQGSTQCVTCMNKNPWCG